jgi:manganese-transporting P-type ATPase
MAELQEIKADPATIKLGDASIASPFTARRTSIDSVLTVLRQGRCSLVTMIQVYKILALNCLVSAYMMSSLYLQGLKQGDTQMTATGLCTAGLFFFVSRAKSLPRLSPEKPPASVFAKSVITSIAGQFVVHLLCLVAVLQLCGQYSDPRDHTFRPIPDSRFQPNLVNSAVYLLASMIQVNNFVVNYRGHPFTESIWDNAALSRSLVAIYFVVFVLISGAFEPLSDFLQLVTFPSIDFQYYLGLILAFDLAAAYGIEKLCQMLE